MCKLYHSVTNEKELLNVFTIFEKLFKYQRNLIETKKALFQEYMEDKEKMDNKSIENLNRMQQNSIDLVNRELSRVNAKTNNLDEINKNYKKAIEETNDSIKILKEEIEIVLIEKKSYEEKLTDIKLNMQPVDEKYTKKKDALIQVEANYDTIKEKQREAIHNQVKNIDSNRDANFQRCLEDLEKEGVTITEKDRNGFKLIFYNFLKSFHEYKLYRDDIEKKTKDIK